MQFQVPVHRTWKIKPKGFNRRQLQYGHVMQNLDPRIHCFHQLSSTFISFYHFLQIPGVKPKKSITFCAATVVGLPKNGGRPKNGHQTMGKTMINQESLIFAVPKSATKPSWATWPKYLKLPDPGPALFEHQLLAVVRNNPNALVETSFEASHLLRNVRPS